jgi:hypothetical protein
MAASHFASIFRDLVHDGYEFNKLCFVKDGFAEPETSRWPSNYVPRVFRTARSRSSLQHVVT